MVPFQASFSKAMVFKFVFKYQDFKQNHIKIPNYKIDKSG
jgi:hypothetical protein